VLAKARSRSLLECVGETLRAALDDLAALAPEWLVAQIPAEWLERYGQRVEHYRLPKADQERKALAEQIGADGLQLLHALEQADAPVGLPELPGIQLLRQVWQQYYDLSSGRARWRAGPEAGAKGGVIRSPYDPEARSSKKRERIWLGYKVHLTETCDGESPHLIVDVQTTTACVSDVEMTALIQVDLAERGLTPHEQVVDSGYVDAELLVTSQQEQGIRLVGPALTDNSWQARADQGFDASHFQIDWLRQQATCPQGQASSRWTQVKNPERIEVVFARLTCAACPLRAQCTESRTAGRVLHLRPQAAHEALHARRAEQQTAAFRQTYACRAGIEGTLAQGVRRSGLRHARYRGQRRTQVQHVLTAVALNVVRLDAWLGGKKSHGTRRSHFERLAWRFAPPFLVA
jgi:transposase